MKFYYRRIIAIIFVLAVGITLGFLYKNRIIWFVYPNKNIYKINGLDISHHQGEIDWKNVDDKFKFIFAKATEGDTFIDKRFYENIGKIKESGRIAGAYHFFHFNINGIEQANNFINVVGNSIDLPPVIDFEFGGNSKNYSEDIMMNELQRYINTLEEYYGSRVIIYVTYESYKLIKKYNISNPIWYRSIIFPINKKNHDILFWQYHNSAKIKGINRVVDLNVFKGSLEDLMELKIKR